MSLSEDDWQEVRDLISDEIIQKLRIDVRGPRNEYGSEHQYVDIDLYFRDYKVSSGSFPVRSGS